MCVKPSVNKVYCSRECRYADTDANKAAQTTNRVTFECRQCGTEKTVPLSRDRGGFCNSGCFYLYNRGENNASWRGGATPDRQAFYSTDTWKDAVKFVWKRDDATCQRCKSCFEYTDGQQFHIHHIIPFIYEEFRADIENLLLVCRECHYWIHSNENAEGLFISEPV